MSEPNTLVFLEKVYFIFTSDEKRNFKEKSFNFFFTILKKALTLAGIHMWLQTFSYLILWYSVDMRNDEYISI